MDHPLNASRMAVARAELAKAKYLHDRVEGRGEAMSGDAREMLKALAFASEAAAADLVEAIKADRQ